MYFKDLLRTEAIERDLDYYHGDWRSLSPSKAANQYKTHITHMSSTQPIRILAYGFTMYLALMSGGQAVRRRLVKAFSLSKDSKTGIGMYDFNDQSPLELRKRRIEWKTQFNLLDWPEGVDGELVDEVACHYFQPGAIPPGLIVTPEIG